MRWCEKKSKGQVKMRVFAQRCNQCPKPPFATPEFTWDNISRILNNLLFRILKKCYKEGFKQMGEIPLVGDTSLEGPHDSGNCEACLLGFCAQNDLGHASKPPAPPLSPTSSKSTRELKVTVTCSNAPCSGSSSKVEKPQASNPTKDDPKVSCTSKPSTIPRLTIPQLSVVSSPAPRCVIQMPSPVDNSRAAHVANKNTTSKTPKSSLSFSLYAPPTSSLYVPSISSYVPPTSSSYVVPISSSRRPPANTTCQVERSSHIHPQSQSSCCKACCGACCGVCGACCGVCGACCEGCCEIIGRCCECYCETIGSCCEGGCNCMSESPLCCLVFLILLLLLWYLL